MRVKNNSQSETYHFLKRGGAVKDGVPETVSVAPGAEMDVDVDEAHPDFVAATTFGDLARVEGGARQKPAAAQSGAPKSAEG